MISWDITNGRGGKFIFRPASGPGHHGSKYSYEERESVRLGIIKAVHRLVKELIPRTPVSAGNLANSWNITLGSDMNGLSAGSPETTHGRPLVTSSGANADGTGWQRMNSEYILGEEIDIWNDQPYAGGIEDKSAFTANLKYSKDKKRSAAFGAAIEAAMSNFVVRFEEVRGLGL